jgi:hypothetical protein
MLTTAWQETGYHHDMCCATNGAHNEIYWAHKKLCEFQCLKMCWFLQYTLWLNIHILFYCYLSPDTLYFISALHTEIFNHTWFIHIQDMLPTGSINIWPEMDKLMCKTYTLCLEVTISWLCVPLWDVKFLIWLSAWKVENHWQVTGLVFCAKSSNRHVWLHDSLILF